ncbi:MAG: hypothetical protein LUD02_06525 [Tannerellaceae bacterium]|nr:hypothetical protein [Tannerellaceae bacterium]
MKISYVDFPEFLKDLHTDYIDYATERKVTLKLNHLPEKEMVWIDFNQLQKVFSNLIFLLIHITKPNGEIMISTCRKTHYLEVTLSTYPISLNKEQNEQLERMINNKNSKESLSFLPDNGFNLALSKV